MRPRLKTVPSRPTAIERRGLLGRADGAVELRERVATAPEYMTEIGVGGELRAGEHPRREQPGTTTAAVEGHRIEGERVFSS